MGTSRTFLSSAVAILLAMSAGHALATAEGPSLMTSGKIASVDAQQNLVKVKTGFFTTKQFVVESDTKITAGQRTLKLEDLQPGAEATIEYMQEDGKHVAQSISLQSDALGSPKSAAQERMSQPKAEPAKPAATEPTSEAPRSTPQHEPPGPAPDAQSGAGQPSTGY